MPLDPQAKALLDQLAAIDAPRLHTLSVADARAMMANFAGMSAVTDVTLAGIADRTIPGPAGTVPVRVYTPVGRAPFPLVVYFHGGGWVLGSLETHDSICRQLAAAAQAVVMSVGYRLAPEYRYPAAIHDCYAALVWAAANAGVLGIDALRIALAGDSAGGNLACVVAMMARDRGGPAVCFQLLVYPVTNYAFDTPSYRENANGYLLEKEAMMWFWSHYLPSPVHGEEPYASPLRAPDLHGLPSALIITAEYDPLRDEGEAYGRRLAEARVPVRMHRYQGMIHGFLGMSPVWEQAKAAMAESAAALQQAFGS